MLELTTYTELEIAHRLQTAYTSRCKHLHGHRYEVEITVSSKTGQLNGDGMVVDFKKLKEIVKQVLDDKWDHSTCLREDDPLAPCIENDEEHIKQGRVHIVGVNPTLEWMVGHWAESLQQEFENEHLGIKMVRLKASETARNTVTWTPAPRTDANRIETACDFARGKVPAIESDATDSYEDDDPLDRVLYLVTYFSRDDGMGSMPISSSFRGVSLVANLRANLVKSHPDATIITFTRIPV